MNNLIDFAVGMIGSNPQIANNPQAQRMIEAIRNNDQAAGEQMARNICNSYGIDPQSAYDQARKFFGI